MPRPRKKPPEDNELRWMTTYGDVVTLMLAFFVMLYAISQVDQQKFLLFVSGLEVPFGNEAVAEGILEGGSAIVGAASNEPEVGDAGIEGLQVLDGMPARSNEVPPPPPTDDGNGTYLVTTDELIALRSRLMNAFEEAGLPTAIGLDTDARGLVVSIATDDVLFPSGSAALSSEGRAIIGVIAPILAEFDNQVLVEGHTDDVPLDRGGYTNWDLSTDRALAVLKLLVDRHGIAPWRLAATGYGEYRPKRDNGTPEGKAANRRVELVIVAHTQPLDIPADGNETETDSGGDDGR